MKNDKNEIEKENIIKEEEMINLGEKNKLKLNNLKEIKNKSIIYKSKSELFFSYDFSFFFSLSISSFPFCYRKKKNGEEMTILNKGDWPHKKLLGNDLNNKATKANNKIKKFKNNILIIIYIIINSFTFILPNINKFLFESKFSNITLKIKGPGYKYILGIDPDEFGLSRSYYPDIIYINGQQNNTITNQYYFDRDDNYVNLIWDNAIDTCYGMFHQCSDITEIDLSNFDNSQVTMMAYMFDGCSQLSSINFSNFKTSKVTNMFSMFNSCIQLSSLNLSNFDTSQVTHMGFMFYYCSQLFSLNLSNFDTKNVVSMVHMFDGCSQLTYLNLKNFIENISLDVTNMFIIMKENFVVCLDESRNKILNIIKNIKCFNIDCAESYLQKKIVNETNICWDDDDNSILYQYEFNGIYYEDCNEGNLINNTHIKNCRCNYTICKSCPNLPLNDTFCSECNPGYYPIKNDIYSYNDKYFKCYENPKGYYLDNDESKYKKCFITCKTCEIKGDNNIHNCIECDDKYKYPTKINNYLNCYENCNCYQYFDNNKTYCTLNFSCPNDYPKLIQDKNECVISDNIYTTSAIGDNIYTSNEIINRFESSIIYNSNSKSTTLIETEDVLKNSEKISFSSEIINKIESSLILNNKNKLKSTILVETEDFIKYSEKKSISSEIINEIESSLILNNKNNSKFTIMETEDFVDSSDSELMSIIEYLINILNNDTIKKTKKEEIEYYDQLIEKIEAKFTSKYFNTSKLCEGKDEVYKTKKMKITLTTSKNQKNYLNDNLTNIDLGKCEKELQKYYNFKENEILYIKKIDIIQEGMRIPKIEYDVFCKLFGDNLTKLNISICTKNDIYLYIPRKDIGNLDLLNKSSDYYNDICSSATSESGADIILNIDKKNILIKQYVKMIVILIIIMINHKKQNVHVKLKNLLFHLLI